VKFGVPLANTLVAGQLPEALVVCSVIFCYVLLYLQLNKVDLLRLHTHSTLMAIFQNLDWPIAPMIFYLLSSLYQPDRTGQNSWCRL